MVVFAEDYWYSLSQSFQFILSFSFYLSPQNITELLQWLIVWMYNFLN